MAKLTDRQKKKIITDYVECGNYSTVSKKYEVSVNTVKRVVNADTATANKVKNKKEANTLDMLEYLDKKKTVVQDIINNSLESLTKKKLQAASPRELMTVIGIALDKFLYDRLNKVENQNDNNFEENRQTFAALVAKNQTVDKNDKL